MIIYPQRVDSPEVLRELLMQLSFRSVEVMMSLAGLRKQTRFACVTNRIVVAVEKEAIVLYATVSDGRDSGYTQEIIQGPCTGADLAMKVETLARAYLEVDEIYWPGKQTASMKHLAEAIKQHIQSRALPFVLTSDRIRLLTSEYIAFPGFSVVQQAYTSTFVQDQSFMVIPNLVVFSHLSSYSYIHALRHVPLLFHLGVSHIWIVDICARCAILHHSPTDSELIYPDQVISINDGLLAGFSLPFNNILLVEPQWWWSQPH